MKETALTIRCLNLCACDFSLILHPCVRIKLKLNSRNALYAPAETDGEYRFVQMVLWNNSGCFGWNMPKHLLLLCILVHVSAGCHYTFHFLSNTFPMSAGYISVICFNCSILYMQVSQVNTLLSFKRGTYACIIRFLMFIIIEFP